FNPDKLDWFNQQHIARLAPDELALRVKPSFEREGLWNDALMTDRHAWFFAVLDLLKPRVKRLGDFAVQGRFFFTRDIETDDVAFEKHVRAVGMDAHLKALRPALSAATPYD